MFYYQRMANNGWSLQIVLDLRQWLIGFNYYDHPWPMWDVFIGPLRFGASKLSTPRSEKV